jgi:hypothetical protein
VNPPILIGVSKFALVCRVLWLIRTLSTPTPLGFGR